MLPLEGILQFPQWSGWTISPATRSATVTGTKRSAPTLQHSPTATMVARRVNALVIVPTYNEREQRSGPRNLDSGLSEISIVFQAAVPKLVASKHTTSGVRRPSAL